MVYGETGRFPVEVFIKQRMLNFWSKLLCQNKLSCIIYKLAYNLFTKRGINIGWISYLKSLLDGVGLSYVWDRQLILCSGDIKYIVKEKMIDQFRQTWFPAMCNSSRGQLYMNLKRELNLEQYLLRLPLYYRNNICKLLKVFK